MRSAAGKDEAQVAVRRVTGELAVLAETAARDVERLLANAKRALRRARARVKERHANGAHDPAAGRRRGQLARAVDLDAREARLGKSWTRWRARA
jgi:transposase, IS5 family